jgi:sterol desaturase/sphingolipid hydroxylase (fatty acid hydroxylase superfamily)
MENIEQRFSEYPLVFEFILLVSVFFTVLAIIETAWDMWRGNRKGWGETLANFSILMVNTFLERTFMGVILIAALVVGEAVTPLNIPEMTFTWGLAILAADFTYYWMHRLEHEIRLLWAFHSVHHSSDEYNLTTAMRLSWFESLFEWLFWLPMVLIGFSVVQTVVALLIVVVYQNWIHTAKIGKLGWFDKVFNTPSVHRVHHGKNRQYIDKNYGGILMVWDRIFGTYEPEREKVEYGITTPPNSVNPVNINIFEIWAMLKQAAQARSWHNAAGYIFRPPGWTPTKDK